MRSAGALERVCRVLYAAAVKCAGFGGAEALAHKAGLVNGWASLRFCCQQSARKPQQAFPCSDHEVQADVSASRLLSIHGRVAGKFSKRRGAAHCTHRSASRARELHAHAIPDSIEPPVCVAKA